MYCIKYCEYVFFSMLESDGVMREKEETKQDKEDKEYFGRIYE